MCFRLAFTSAFYPTPDQAVRAGVRDSNLNEGSGRILAAEVYDLVAGGAAESPLPIPGDSFAKDLESFTQIALSV